MRIKRSTFGRRLAEINGLDRQGFLCWLLSPGTKFLDRQKWWQMPENRPAPHEGLDFCRFLTKRGEVAGFPKCSLVTVMFAGKVVSVFDDFLGKSVLIGHDIGETGGYRLHSICAHLVTDRPLAAGEEVQEGTVLGRMAPTEGKSIPAHLHLSTIWLPGKAGNAEITWKQINSGNAGKLCDPLEFLEPADFCHTAVS